MTRNYVLFFLMVFTIPIFLGINVWQSNKCGIIKNEIRKLEKTQEQYIKESKATANEIAGLLTVDRLEAEAQKMGFQKMVPEDVILIIMGGKEHGRR